MKYTNPVLPADFSDPDVIRVDNDFYMVSSSFNYNPCIPVLHSVNLVDWDIVGYVMDNLPLEEYKKVVHGGGVWAPSLRYHNGIFYCCFPLYGHGIWVCETKDIRGRWSAPRQLLTFEGLEDPCPIWTDDGKCYMAVGFAKSKAGFNSVIGLYEVSSDLTKALGSYKIIYDGHDNNPCIEGPKFYFHGGYYYIYAPAGGVKHGWQTALRSKNIYGPYESKIVMIQGDSNINGPHQGALIDLPDGRWAFIHFTDRGAYGRVTCLEPAEWVDGWCICGEVKDKLIAGWAVNEWEYPLNTKGKGINYSDNFESRLSPVWQTPAVCGDKWYSVNNGLKIEGCSHTGGVYSLEKCLAQRFSAFNFEVSVKVEAEGNCVAALAVTGLTSYSLCLTDGKTEIRVSDSNGESTLLSAYYGGNSALLGVIVKEVNGNALCCFTVDGKPFGDSFYAVAGRWVGSHIALYCTGDGTAVFTDYKVKV